MLFRLATLLLGLIAGLLPLDAQGSQKIVPSLSQREKIAKESRQALQFLENYHYIHRPVDDIPSATLIRDFIGDLDYHHMIFTEEQIQKYIKRFETTLHNAYLSRGDIFPAIEIYNDYYKLTKERLKWIKKRLTQKFNFSNADRYQADRKKADWPADEKAADELWDKRLRNEMLVELLNNATIEDASKKLLRRYERNERIIEEFDTNDLQSAFLSAIGSQYDPHTVYFSMDTLEDFSIQMSNTLVGIGAMLRSEDGICVIQELIAGGPAERSGKIHTGDKIVEVAQEGESPVDVVDLKISKIVQMIRGKPNTVVKLTIIPADAADDSVRKVISITRQEVKLTENLASAQIIEVPNDDEGLTLSIGVITLPSFYGGQAGSPSPSKDIAQLLGKLEGMSMEGLVLDLRNNGGGLLSEAIAVAGLFLPQAPVVQVSDSMGRTRIDWDRNTEVAYNGPMVVLTSRMSASASEIVAGALQSHKRAIVVGDSATHGKGTVQAIFEIGKGLLSQFTKKSATGGIKVTIQKFYLPNGESTQNKGVPSDIALPSLNDVLPIGESDLDNALDWDSISPAQSTLNDLETNSYLTGDMKSYLTTRSAKRQAELPEFSLLQQIVERLKLKEEEKSVSLNYDVRLKEKQLDEAFKLKSERRRKELANQNRYDSADVLLDLSYQMEAQHQAELHSTPLPNGKPRANAIYENIFYYAPEGSSQIKEVRIEEIDFEAMLAYQNTLSKRLGLTTTQTDAIFNLFRQGEERRDFNIHKIFEKALTDSVSAERLSELPREFMLNAIELNPEIAQDHPSLDIPLREALRVAADWASVKKTTLTQEAKEPTAQQAEMATAQN